jgi:hypothetical protein
VAAFDAGGEECGSVSGGCSTRARQWKCRSSSAGERRRAARARAARQRAA